MKIYVDEIPDNCASCPFSQRKISGLTKQFATITRSGLFSTDNLGDVLAQVQLNKVSECIFTGLAFPDDIPFKDGIGSKCPLKELPKE